MNPDYSARKRGLPTMPITERIKRYITVNQITKCWEFTTPKENSRNCRNTKRLTINGETKTVVEWCEQLGLSQYTVYDWIRKKGNAYAEQRISEIA